MTSVLSKQDLSTLDAYWRASNYLAAGQIYLKKNPLLSDPLAPEDIKPRLLGHWGTTPGLNFIYTHLNRLIRRHDLDMIYVIGPGHGGNAVIAQTYLEGSYSERHPEFTQDTTGMQELFKRFSWPYGISSHIDVGTPGAIHFGGELGYSLLHAYGAAFDNPDLIVACVVGDGEAETGPCAGSWHSNKFLNPVKDGAVLPILHLNGYKISNPTFLARMPEDQLEHLFIGYGYKPYFLTGDAPDEMHAGMAEVLEKILEDIHSIQQTARRGDSSKVARWPVLILRTPKGWTGPKIVDGQPVEGSWRSHQIPVSEPRTNPEHLRILEEWLRSYRPEELFDAEGHLRPELQVFTPTADRRMGMNPHANGGMLLKELDLPEFRNYAVKVDRPGCVQASATKVLGDYMAIVFERSESTRNFRLFAPDETASNKVDQTLEVTSKEWEEAVLPTDENLGRGGRVMEVLSEHMLEGWLEAYLLTGRHGILSSYEAFIHIIDSMFNQHAKWLKLAQDIPWRAPIASLNYLLTSHVWQQDHNGFTHQDPGFLDHVANKKSDVVRIYLPPDANCLLAITDRCLKSRDNINVVVAGKQETPQWLTVEEAVEHCARGASIWPWASSGSGRPDVVMACCGDVPTIETLAAVSILRERVPSLRIRVVNVVDLMTLGADNTHPHALENEAFVELFSTDSPVIFAFHGYPSLVHRLIGKRPNQRNFHVHGYLEEGAATTAFDMTVLNGLDRFTLAMGALRHSGIPDVEQNLTFLAGKLDQHRSHVKEHGEDMPEIMDWQWTAG